MISVFPANTDVNLNINFVLGDGTPTTPVSALYRVKRANEVVVANTIISLAPGETSAQVTVNAMDNVLRAGRIRETMTVEVEGVDGSGAAFFIESLYVIESRNVLVKGENTFAEWYELILEAIELRDLTQFNATTYTDADRKNALINAYQNLVQLPFSRDKMRLTASDVLFSADTLDKLSVRHMKRLKRAQLIEADNILGGNPVEDRRRAGMISDSAGESAHFFRSGKPLELPCCRRAVTELGPVITWSWAVRH